MKITNFGIANCILSDILIPRENIFQQEKIYKNLFRDKRKKSLKVKSGEFDKLEPRLDSVANKSAVDSNGI